jgi:hypothetical protein
MGFQITQAPLLDYECDPAKQAQEMKAELLCTMSVHVRHEHGYPPLEVDGKDGRHLKDSVTNLPKSMGTIGHNSIERPFQYVIVRTLE